MTNRLRLDKEEDLLLIFTRNPELGKCKTRLAADIGAQAALDIYNFLLQHTVDITSGIQVDKCVYYSEAIWEHDIWEAGIYHKALQKGDGLGARMQNAFEDGFQNGYAKIVIIGSDIHDLGREDIEQAFKALDHNDYVLGPAQDGGYYLLGMKKLNQDLFQNKSWGSRTVLKQTLADMEGASVFLLPLKNDIDLYEDIKNNPTFKPFIKHIDND